MAPTHRSLPPLLVYRVHTPVDTLVVTVLPTGQGRHCTPLMRPRWLGQEWATIRVALERHYGAGLRITGLGLQCPRTFYTDLDTLICKSEQPLSPNTLYV